MKKYIAYVLEETLPINESAKICTTPLRRWKSTRQPNLGSTLSGNYANTVTDLPIVIFYEKNFRPFRAFLFFSQQWIPNHMRMPSILKKVVKMLHLENDASEQKK